MKKKKLLSLILAMLMALDVICFSLTLTYHVTACEESNASISMEQISEPTGQYSEEVVIIEPSYDDGFTFPKNPDIIDDEYVYVNQSRRPAAFAVSNNFTSKQMVYDNMFPGDSVSETYKLAVSHSFEVALHFNIENIRLTPEGDTTPLSDVLCMRLTVNGTERYNGKLVEFDGLIAGFEASLEREAMDIIEYTVEVYLPTSTGNDYMLNGLICDFVWTLYEEPVALPPVIIPIPDHWPDMGDDDPEEIEPEVPVEGITEFETFDYIPAPCYFTVATAIMAIILVALAAAFVAVRRKEQRDEK